MKTFCYDYRMKNLVVTVSPDSSIELLMPYSDVIVLDKDLIPEDIEAYNTLYIRSHFGQSSMMPQNFRSEINTIVQRVKYIQPKLILVDGIDNVDAILAFEDKWLQYGTFSKFMPRTEVYDGKVDVSNYNRPIFKKRLSSRGKGVTWDESIADVSTGEWLIQESITIAEELRIYVICGEVHPVCAIKSSMTENGRSRSVDCRDLTQGELDFSLSIYNQSPELDFIGIDVARTSDGALNLMEVNRSPGFAKFEQLTGVNLANILYDKLNARSS